jgi:Family of unknown function (DUF5689)/Domain of unknown function (DUF5017)
MKSFVLKSIVFIFTLSSLVSLSSCIKNEFDSPPTNIPEITDAQIMTFDELLTNLKVGTVTTLQEDKYLEALVVADDKSGNIFKNLILHDVRGEKGITMSIDENEIHAIYPAGTVVFVSLKNTALGYFEGLPSLGVNESNKVGRIPSSLMRSKIINSGRTLPVVPKKVKVEDLNSDYFSTLIELEGMQFVTANSTTTYADPFSEEPQSINHDVQNCTGGQLVLRNSGYADFAGLVVPSGNGKLVAVYSYYRSAAQLLIRDVTDLTFTGERCDGTGGGPTGDRVSIQSLRSQYTGTPTTITKGFAQGIVISDIANKNINGQNMIVQDGDFGILFRFKAPINIPLGTEVKVGLTGGSLSEFNNILQVQNLENTNVEVISAGKSVTPKTMTVSQIDNTIHESTLIKVENATLIGGSKLSDSGIKVKDASGEIALFTLAASTFGAQTLPSGTVTITAIVSDFTSGKQLIIRNPSDISGGGPCDVNVGTADCDGDGVANAQDCSPLNSAIFPGGTCDDGNAATVNDQYNSQCVCLGSAAGAGFNEGFNGQSVDMDIAISGWENVAVTGNRKWQGKTFSGNTYAQATAFGTTAPPEMETWLISPVVNTSAAGNLSFETAKAFYKHDGLSVWATTNYTGNPTTTTWTQISAKVAGSADADNTFVPSGNVDIRTFGASVRIGFKYVGTQAANTTTYRIDNVKVQ